MQSANSLVPRRVLACISLVAALSLQGCGIAVPRHSIGNWEAKPNYYLENLYIPPGGTSSSAVLNSCSSPDVVSTLQCNGHGQCQPWSDVGIANATAPRLSFCSCERDWAGPECTGERQSQVSAFLLSVFLGVVGADQFYLGFIWAGVFKLLTLGGLGVWYVYDLVRIGSSPVYTSSGFRLAADLSHAAFILLAIVTMLFFGFAISVYCIMVHKNKKAHELMLLQAKEMAAAASGLGSAGTAQPWGSERHGTVSNPHVVHYRGNADKPIYGTL